MIEYAFSPEPQPAVAIDGAREQFPVNRVFCVGRNYAAHTREMGGDPEREEPFYFTKSARAITASGAEIPYPPGTANYHHEIELVIALGQGGFEVAADDALALVFGYAVGLDMTRRDLQIAARDKGRPWSVGKDIEHGAVISPIRRLERHPAGGRIWLAVNDTIRQDSDLADLIWTVPEIIAHLSRFYHLAPGDLIYSGTPEGVGPVVAGDRITGGVAGVGDIELRIAATARR